jgi:K+-sensing histidine kinase KdpD
MTMTQPAEAAAVSGDPSGPRARGQLRIYLGAAPGVGKTYAMLCEAHRRVTRGTDVVAGFVETHGRAKTAALVEGLEVLPRRSIPYRGTAFEEMDTDAVIARRPQVAVVDELAHTNIPGSCYAKRWQDIEDLLAAGITVLSTVNIQHLESLNDVVQTITGVPQRETVPDQVVRTAEQVELVDITRRRCAGGWRTATSTPRTRSTRRWGTSSGSATSPRCASWPCCGWLRRWTSSWTGTATSMGSRPPGRPGSGSWSR